MSITGQCLLPDSVRHRNEVAEMFWKSKENVAEKIQQVEELDKEFMNMDEVMQYLPFCRSRCYELKDEGVLEAVNVGTLRRPSYKYLTRSVLRILLEIEKEEDEEEKLKVAAKKERQRRITQIRRRLYGT